MIMFDGVTRVDASDYIEMVKAILLNPFDIK
jgi:hypothetical protein